ncbi:MAG: Pyrimidine-nucleoside phosphorylase [Tenericutes bacterium ADurb.Bin239]|jgi:pyrimidine-nucleoside phosphorylase|nr:MAG: Pyrimidine-nucleoside phosphorylase [Tenericutes bacterium ADurb.Bin239]
MRMYDIILKKRDGLALTEEEIKFFVKGVTAGTIPDYQTSSLLMAIVWRGMNKEETAALTLAMMHSGDVIDLSPIKGIKVDKHSTGGVGDKTSLVLGPLVASFGVKVAKMSGRGLGHTGGTLDKLESIPGTRIDIPNEDFIKQVNEVGCAIIGQTGHLVPADKKLYALRDVTATVEAIPLIASSIMSKKLASGSDTILLDVKFGSGAFMKTLADAQDLARAMVNIGKSLNRDTRAILTDMDQPLGLAVGNALEVKEAIATLKGEGPADLTKLCIEAACIMLEQAGVVQNANDARKAVEAKIKSGAALQKLVDMIAAQHGDASYITNPEKFTVSKHVFEVLATRGGYVEHIDSMAIGIASMKLGGGRETYDDVIDMSAGIVLNKKVGDKVKVGERLALVYTNKADEVSKPILVDVHDAFKLSAKQIKVPPIIHDYIK